MPSLKRRSKRHTAGYTEHHVFELESGYGWPFLGPDECFHGNRDAQRRGWEDLRETILSRWIAEKLGTRPWAWWEFDAPERRRVVNGATHPHDNPERRAMVEQARREHPNAYAKAEQLWYGMPASYFHEHDRGVRFEGEPMYLARLGLLTPEEREHPEVAEVMQAMRSA